MGSARTTWLVTVGTALALLLVVAPAQALDRPMDPGDGASGDHFGSAVALDGNTLVVGAPDKKSPTGTLGQGAAYVYTRTAGETWTQSAKLTASDGAERDHFGTAVAIEGNTIVVGAPGNDDGKGAIYLFDRTGAANRIQREKLVASDASKDDGLGQALDIDNGTIVAGAPDDDNPGENINANHGSVYVFAAVGAPDHHQSAKLTASDNTLTGCLFCGSRLGESVAIDGDTIVAGAPIDAYGSMDSSNRRGSVYTFASTGASTRTETAKLSVSGTAYGRLGVAVDILGDTILAGDDDGNSAYGTIYAFARTGAAVRHETGTLTSANPRQNSGFGRTISMAGDFVVIGAPSYSAGGSASAVGAGYVFTRTGPTSWKETWFTGSTQRSGGEQYGTGIVTDGRRVIGGAPGVTATSPGYFQGQGRVYSSTPDLYVSKTGTGTGTIGSSPSGIDNCASSCSASYLLGDQVTLTATPGSGSSFGGWLYYPNCSSTPTCVVTMTGAPQLAAQFNVGGPDTTPPTVGIGSGPASGSIVASGTVTFGFTANETSTFQCAYDAQGYVPCTSPGPGTSGSDTRTGLANGSHTFKLLARDIGGNYSTEQTRTFTVRLPGSPPPRDTTPPQTTITKAPVKKVRTKHKKATVRISFAASERATFLCSVDGQSARPCASPAKFKLRRGKHTIAITAVDSAGNRDLSPATVKVKVKKRK